MKPLVAAAAFAALAVIAGPVSAQMYPQADAPMGVMGPQMSPGMGWAPDAGRDPDAGAGGPQFRFMESHGYTANDAMPPNGRDVYSDELNAAERDHPRYHVIYPAEGPEPY
ncbi:MAG: hypothetical protein ACREFB_10835 [Stellaceae bacterium]